MSRTCASSSMRVARRRSRAATQVAARGRPGPLKSLERTGVVRCRAGARSVAGFALWRGRTPEPVAQQVIRFQVPPPTGKSFGALGSGGAFFAVGPTHALSPDGTRLVFYASDRTGKGALYLRALDSFEPRQLPQTEGGGGQPFWSPDGRFVAFFADRRLYKLDLLRGERFEICAVTGNPRGGYMGRDRHHHLYDDQPTGNVERALGRRHADDGIGIFVERCVGFWPSFLPDGRRFLYLARSRSGTGGAVFLAEVGSEAQSRELVPSDTQAAYVEPGYLLFGRDARLFRQLFDVRTGEVSGDAVPVVDQLRTANVDEGLASSRPRGSARWPIDQGSIRRINSRGSLARGLLRVRSVYQDGIARRPCHRMAGAWCIPTSATAT